MSNNNDILALLDDEHIKTEFFMEEQIEISTVEVKRALKNFFKHIQVRSSAATLLLTKFGLKEAAQFNQTTIDEHLINMMKDMSQDVTHTKSIIDDAGITATIMVNGLVTGTLKITSPVGYQFLMFLKMWDKLNMNLNMLYMRQEIGQEEVAKSTKQWVHRVRKFNNVIESLSVTAYKATEQLKKDARAKESQRPKAIRHSEKKAIKAMPIKKQFNCSN